MAISPRKTERSQARIEPAEYTNSWGTMEFGMNGDGQKPAFFTQMQSDNDDNAAVLRFKGLQKHQVKIFVENERSAGQAKTHEPETIGSLILYNGAFDEQYNQAILPPLAQGNHEMGRITNLDHNVQTVQFLNTYVNPVVIAGALSYNGGDPSTVRVMNVDANSFQIQLQEWAYLDGPHTTETISWMVTEAGCHNPTGDNGYCAGVIPEVTDRFTKIDFPERMRGVPVLFS
jgi:serralysin